VEYDFATVHDLAIIALLNFGVAEQGFIPGRMKKAQVFYK
jgi:hypothetical protein